MVRRKAQLDQVVQLADGRYAVVVGYSRDDARAPFARRYMVIQTDGLGRHPRGPTFMLHSHEFTVIDNRKSETPGIVLRGNQRLERVVGDRGCQCHCCVHEDAGTYASALA